MMSTCLLVESSAAVCPMQEPGQGREMLLHGYCGRVRRVWRHRGRHRLPGHMLQFATAAVWDMLLDRDVGQLRRVWRGKHVQVCALLLWV